MEQDHKNKWRNLPAVKQKACSENPVWCINYKALQVV